MIVEMRTYTAHPGKAATWLEHYQKMGLPVQQELLGKLIFFGTTELGPLNQIVHVWAYESLAQREQCRAKLAKDPRWHDFQKNTPPGCMAAMETKILNPTAFSPLK